MEIQDRILLLDINIFVKKKENDDERNVDY